MEEQLPNLVPVIPEIFLLVMSLVILLVGSFAQKYKAVTFYLAEITIVIVAWLTWHVFADSDLGQRVWTFGQAFILDRLAVTLKLFIYLSVFLTFIYSRQYNED